MVDTLDRLRSALANRYAVERELGAGGMATVYLAHDDKLGRAVALTRGVRLSRHPPTSRGLKSDIAIRC